MLRPQSNRDSFRHADPSRRGFLQGAAGITAGLALAAATPSDALTAEAEGLKSGPRLPTVALGPHQITRLILGEVPMGEVYLPSDRDRMLQVVRAARKPCLVYKVLAAGRANLSPAGIREAFQFTLSHIKSTDAMIVGMFQEFGDQVAMNAGLVRELCTPG